MITGLCLVSAIGIALLLAGRVMARKPAIQLKILLERSFAGVFLMTAASFRPFSPLLAGE
jgi:hypothetical protein